VVDVVFSPFPMKHVVRRLTIKAVIQDEVTADVRPRTNT
jgi:hypothetical protein